MSGTNWCLSALFFASALSLLAAGCHGEKKSAHPRVVVAGQTFSVEIANTPESRARGLSGRLSLPPDAGMLFLFDAETVQSFWMKDCYMSIDVAFMDAGGKILTIYTMPVEDFPPEPRHTYESTAPSKYVLEVAGGTFERIGAKPGMTVTFIDVPGISR